MTEVVFSKEVQLQGLYPVYLQYIGVISTMDPKFHGGYWHKLYVERTEELREKLVELGEDV